MLLPLASRTPKPWPHVPRQRTLVDEATGGGPARRPPMPQEEARRKWIRPSQHSVKNSGGSRLAGHQNSTLLTLLMNEYFISFYIVFHWFYASTISFTNNYHWLLWILQYCLVEFLFLFITGFRPIFHEIHHNLPQVRKDLQDSVSMEIVIKRGLVGSRLPLC